MNVYPKVRAEISAAALKNNYEMIEKLTGKPQICVVKADCYGHGIECAGVFYDCGCRVFAVSGSGEALELREFFNEKQKHPDILILGYVNPADVPELIENDIIAAVFSEEYAKLCREKIKDGEKLRVHIKINSGMNRIGFDPDGLDGVLSVCRDGKFKVEGIFTHFACADSGDEAPTLSQIACFDKSLAYFSENGVVFGTVHAYNSAASVRFSPKYDAVRSGIVLYGLDPSDAVRLPGIIPAMTLKTEVAQVRKIKAGGKISYGWDYEAGRDMTVATLPVGYADGYIRAYGKGYALIGGKKAPLVGRICMDQCMADVTGIENVSCGDEAVMFGGNGISADELAALSCSINYEVPCLISKRVKRILK